MEVRCRVDDCTTTKLMARGMCGPHYKRWWRHGDPTAGNRRAPDGATAEERLRYVGWDVVAVRADLTPCWQWRGLTDRGGYGRLWDGTRVVAAHRMAYEVHRGPIPHDTLVRHTCDYPPCVNPQHLLLGDDAANAADMVERSRWAGQRTPKIGPEAQQRIRTEFTGRRGEMADLAREYDVTPSYIHRIVKGGAR